MNIETKYKRFFDLGMEKIAQIDSYLLKGTTTVEIARIMQKEWGVFQDVSTGTLERQVRRYREDTLKSQMALIAPSSDEGQEEQRIVLHKLINQLDPIVELQELAEVQKARIKRALARENQLPFLLDGVSREINLLADLYSRMGKLMIDVGLLRKMMGSRDPAMANKVLGILEVYNGQVEISDTVKEATQKALQIISGDFEHVSTDNQKATTH